MVFAQNCLLRLPEADPPCLLAGPQVCEDRPSPGQKRTHSTIGILLAGTLLHCRAVLAAPELRSPYRMCFLWI